MSLRQTANLVHLANFSYRQKRELKCGELDSEANTFCEKLVETCAAGTCTRTLHGGPEFPATPGEVPVSVGRHWLPDPVLGHTDPGPQRIAS